MGDTQEGAEPNNKSGPEPMAIIGAPSALRSLPRFAHIYGRIIGRGRGLYLWVPLAA